MTILFLFFPSPALAANSGIFTVSLWVKPTSSIASQALVGKAEELRVFTDASGNAGCQIKSTTWQTASTGTTALTLNSWNHVACTYDKVKLTVYVNGTQTSQTSLTPQIDDTANALLLGQDSSASTPYSNLTGTTDDFKFYNYARTQDQIIEDMGGGHPAVMAGSSGPSTSSGRSGGPIGYWKFDEGYGTTANNVGNGGSALNGTLTGMSSPATSTSGWTQAGKFNRALNFDGSDDTVDLGNPSVLGFDRTNAFGTCAWIYPTNITDGGNTIISKINTSNVGWEFTAYDNASASDRLLVYLINTWPSNRITVYTTNSVLSANSWQHVCFTYDGSSSASGVSIYLNGKKQTTTTLSDTLTASIATSVNVRIGTRPAASTFPFNGSIDEVKIYPYALTADQVKLDMNQGASQVLGALSDNSSYQPQAANQEYCVPGDTATCSAPVGRWDFEEGTGTSVNDTSGNANTGTWAGTGNHWANGKSGNGKTGNFNGSDDYVDAGTGISSFNPVTVSAWVKRTGTAGAVYVRSVVAKDNNTGGRTFAFGMTGTLSSGTENSAYLEINGTANFPALQNSTALNLNQWYFLTWNYDGSTYRLYQDGIQVASTVSGVAPNSSTTSLTIGRRNYPGHQGNFPGVIDDVRIYNYARSAAQIAWDYNRGGPVGWWKFDECQGAVANDSSGNSNTGTITIGSLGSQSSLGTCVDGSSTSAWNNGKSGKRNYSLNFDGTDDYVSLSNSSALSPGSGDFAIAVWVKTPASLDGNSHWIYGDYGSNQNNLITLYMNSNNFIAYYRDAGLNIASATTTTAPSTSTWYHLVAVKSGTNVYLYQNGVQVASGSNTSLGTITTSDGLIPTIGEIPSGGQYWNGQIDDVRVYNYPLTATQIKTLYSDGAYRSGPVSGAP